MPMDEKPSKNEDEYFAKQNLEIIHEMRVKLDAERRKAERKAHHNKCPRCGCDLKEHHAEQVKVDACPECGGLWLDTAGSNTLNGNESTDNDGSGFWIQGPTNTLNGNRAEGNTVFGLAVRGYAGNSLDHNNAAGNGGDGFSNDGTNTVFTNNNSHANGAHDCTSDSVAPSNEGASIATNTGNTCADGHVFDLGSTLTGW